ncbi:MAG: ABC transporter ATP-binding protein [Selenomonas sp.]|uniref:ABC transporter ATP-binding protein n=1 Tax=Selenomonas sp. TaxID=2053611 RepID=UPI0025DBB583|nr:ABC transporter ATP-binding protein [Selenomonas sp.]MCR5757427.1 ABC transporter ATP-binding protein [Selenomonas sp.]
MVNELLDVQGLQAGYNGRNVLRQVSFQAGSGELIGLIGPNGAGKSTLLKAMRGLLPTGGKITLQGKKLQEYSPQEMAKVVAYLPQRSHVPFAFTVREVVLMGRAPHLRWWQREGPQDIRIAEACMEYMAVKNLADMPVNTLSGGQRQRVLLAKVLAQQTPLLLLDEPASGLDLFYQEELFRFCRELCQADRTILLVVHDLSLAARFCSRLLLIGQNKLLADGAPKAVLQPELLSQAYGVAVHVGFHPQTGHADIYTQEVPREQPVQSLLTKGDAS